MPYIVWCSDCAMNRQAGLKRKITEFPKCVEIFLGNDFSLSIFIFGTERLMCLKYANGGGGEVEARTTASSKQCDSWDPSQQIQGL